MTSERWLLVGLGVVVLAALGYIFRRQIISGWRSVQPWVSRHFTLAEVSLAVCFLVFLTSPLTKKYFHTDIENLLIFCGGLSNLVAVIDISRQNQLTSSSRRRVRIVLTGQLLIIAFVIGADASRLISSHMWQTGISFCAAVIFTLVTAYVDRPYYVKLGWLTFGLILSLAVHVIPEILEKLGTLTLAQEIPTFVSLRLHTWTHLLVIPLVYFIGDSLLRKDIETSRIFFPLDIVIAGLGILGIAIAAGIDNPAVDAGLAAFILIGGNCLYIVWVNKPRTEMRDRVNIEVSRWNNWSEALWHRNEGLWIKRNGQDHFYREQVVLPTLLKEIGEGGHPFKTLVDLGSGDGYTTNRLLERLAEGGVRLDSVLLVDRSSTQLGIAKTLPFLRDAVVVQKDLIEEDWADAVMTSESPKIFLSVFVLQEVPRVHIFFSILSRAMNPADMCLAVLVDPEYSQKLYRDGTIKVVGENRDQSAEWEWAGEYPITIDTTEIYLPHFQRRIDVYRQIAAENGLSISEPASLVVQDTPEAREVFGHTIYGQGIIGVGSSILLKLTKTA